ncbi:methyl-accepting chemotaxis protein [Clostridium oryzae]|uniref:Methyl-accepting chemotaxis protein McpB n=1 Tax=Clostridium oryzae TaxID=1450648 RepID=A0A1V4I6J8_9CLOT|nr:methyl-accepting chemotaxis protein [Clostridium oryzae]OPJ55225.1 methyl-accepting chemotaxis protein McpB [Clostridium oryzae]
MRKKLFDFKTKPRKIHNVEPKREKKNKLNDSSKTRNILEKVKNSMKFLSNIGKNSKIKTRLVATFLVLTVVPISTVGIFSYNIARNTIKNKVSTFSTALLEQMSINLNSVLTSYQDMSTLVISNSKLSDLLWSTTSDDYDRFQRYNEQQDALSSIANSDPDVSSFFLYMGPDQESIGSISSGYSDYFKNQFGKSDLYNKIMKSNSGSFCWVTGLNKNDSEIYLFRKYTDVKYSKFSAIIVISIKSERFTNVAKKMKLDEGTSLRIFDTSKKNIFTFTSSGTKVPKNVKASPMVYQRKTGSFTQHNILTGYSTLNNGWKLAYEAPYRFIMKEVTFMGAMTLAVGAICILIAIIIGFAISLGISKPIGKFMEVMKKTEDGDLNISFIHNSKDEIGHLSSSFNVMIEKIKGIISSTQDAAQKVSSGTESINSSSKQSAESAKQVAAAVEEIAKGSVDQARKSEEAINTIKELADKIEVVTKGAEDVKKTSGKTKDIGVHSVSVVNELNQKTEESLKVVNEINDYMSALRDSSVAIEKIVEVIKGISDQTSLLSLNASIEAARAGEAGRGFAVVADEVRKLADQSAKSTGEISQIISDIRNKTEDTFVLVEKANVIFKAQEGSVKNTDSAFKEIITSTDYISSQLENITNIVKDMNAYKENAINAVEDISVLAEESSASTEQVMASIQEQTASSEEIAGLSDRLFAAVKQLNDSMTVFKL